MRHCGLLIIIALLLSPGAWAVDDVPRLIPYQGWVQVDGRNHDGAAAFKFAILSADGATTYWSHDGSSSGGAEPTGSVSLTVTNGLFALRLGDTTISGMQAIPYDVFDAADAHLAVWFDDGSNGFAQLGPLQPLGTSPWAFRAQEARGVDSESAAAGQVLTADGSGGSYWTTPTGGGGGGDITGAANLGSGGVGPFITEASGVLQFRTINAGSAKITITDDTADNEIDIDIDESALVIDADSTTLSNIDASELKAGFLDTDLSTVPGDDSSIASSDAVKTYVDGRTAINQSTLVGDGVAETALDLSGITSLKVDTGTSAEAIEGITGGSAGQEVKIFNAGTNSLTLSHNAGSGSQDILAPAEDDVVLGAYGGVTMVCDGSAWYIIERATTYED